MFEIFDSYGNRHPYQMVKFSGGELQPRINLEVTEEETTPVFTIRASMTEPSHVVELMLLTDALRRMIGDFGVISLECPYLPYARQDRVCFPGESLALKVMCDIVNSLGFSIVIVWDVHSDVSLALLDRVHNKKQHHFYRRIPWTNTVLVAPDAGAMKKTLEAAKELGLPMVRADKIRSADTGEITGTVVYSEHIGDRDFLIADDICDGGRTFIELAKVLRPLTNGKIYLYVTHGIFSKGLDVFNGLIDGVYTANPFPGVDLNHKLLTVI